MQNRSRVSTAGLVAVLSLAMGLVGCGSLGPRTLDRDQINYGISIADNWKNQMLANLVKIRYIDMPVFVDVGQIVAGYSLETQVNGGLGFSNSLTGGDSQAIGAAGRYTDRPTITYMPKTGENFLRSLLEPVNPGTLLSLIAAGYNPEMLFTWAVESINGIHNFSGLGANSRAADPEYYEFVDLLSAAQQSGAVGFEVKEDSETGQVMVLTLKGRNMAEADLRKRNRIRELLDLDPEQNEFRVVYSPFRLEGDVLAIQTRSNLQIMSAMASFVDVPPDKIARAAPVSAIASLPAAIQRPFTVHTSTEQPKDPFAGFKYNGDWYWIDHEDLSSKRVFTLMLFMTTLTHQGGGEVAPVLTIPTN